MKIFQKNLMASEDVQVLLGSGVFYEGSEKAPIHDGALVEVGDIEAHSIYANLKDVNIRKITAPTADTTNYAIVDYVNRSEGEIQGVTYREGIKTAGLVAPAGKQVRYRFLAKNDTFYLGTDNFVGAPAEGKFAIPTADSTLWTITDEKAENGPCLKIETKKALTEGAVDTDTLYFCTVVNA
jgi:hypothetical protein